MKRMIAVLLPEKRLFLWSLIYLGVIAVVMMAQNYIRYGWHADYNPWPTVIFLGTGVVLFILILPFYSSLLLEARRRYPRYFWPLMAVLAAATILTFFLFSSGLLYIAGYFENFFKSSFTRFYFGRAVIFHLLWLAFIAVYFFFIRKSAADKQISGSLGRKRVTIKAELARWIEADDHYLRIHFNDGVIVKRSTLDQMSRELTPDFIRIHRKYLVNRNQVVGKEKNKRDEYLILSSGERLKVGRSYLPLEW